MLARSCTETHERSLERQTTYHINIIQRQGPIIVIGKYLKKCLKEKKLRQCFLISPLDKVRGDTIKHLAFQINWSP